MFDIATPSASYSEFTDYSAFNPPSTFNMCFLLNYLL